MASYSSSPDLNCFLVILLLFFAGFPLLQARNNNNANAPSPSVSSDPICSSTPHPSYCRSLLPKPTANANVYYYGRFSLRKSLSQSIRFLATIDRYLSDSSSFSEPEIRALQDCRFLAGLNYGFLSSSANAVNTSTSATFSDVRADDIQTLLSAVITNLETCSDSINSVSSWSVKNGISNPIFDDTKLYSVSLALFRKGWVPKKRNTTVWKPRRKQLGLSRFRHKKIQRETLRRNLLALNQGSSTRKLLQTVDGLVSVSEIVVVSQDGSENFTTITDAVDVAPNKTLPSTDGYFVIYVMAGVYGEYVNIPSNKKNLMIIGDGINQTVITGNRSVGDGWTTFNSATFIVVGANFIAVNITIRNTAGPAKGQAVALRNGADLSTFYSCSFEAYQDTLYTHSQRQFYRECDVYGTVDFIFGNAAVVLQNCNLYPRLPNRGQSNEITAQGRTDPNQNTGISIQNCNILPAADLAADNGITRTYLGRPWKEYSRTVYMESYMGSFINPGGWNAWSGDFALSTLYYAEFNNSGPGSNTTNRVSWAGYHVINATDAANFTVSNFISGDYWLPQTGVPYDGGL